MKKQGNGIKADSSTHLFGTHKGSSFAAAKAEFDSKHATATLAACIVPVPQRDFLKREPIASRLRCSGLRNHEAMGSLMFGIGGFCLYDWTNRSAVLVEKDSVQTRLVLKLAFNSNLTGLCHRRLPWPGFPCSSVRPSALRPRREIHSSLCRTATARTHYRRCEVLRPASQLSSVIA